MQLELSEEERRPLRRALQSYVSHLREEIVRLKGIPERLQ